MHVRSLLHRPACRVSCDKPENSTPAAITKPPQSQQDQANVFGASACPCSIMISLRTKLLLSYGQAGVHLLHDLKTGALLQGVAESNEGAHHQRHGQQAGSTGQERVPLLALGHRPV